jgi:hypothetical protein
VRGAGVNRRLYQATPLRIDDEQVLVKELLAQGCWAVAAGASFGENRL